MRLELKDIKDGCLHQEETFSVTDFPVLAEMEKLDGISFIAPIHFKLRFQKSGQLVEVDGALSSTVSVLCGRCLQEYEEALAGDFSLTFTPFVAADQPAQEEDAEIELDTDELGLVYYQDDCLELLQPLQDQVVMVLPSSPLCSDQCQGLCSECGCNLNAQSCKCEKKVFNNKFTALAGLKVEPSND